MINESIAAGSADYEGYYQKSRTELLDLLGDSAPSQALEIGCGAGANLIELRRRFPDCRTTGVELRPDAVQLARASGRIDRVFQQDLLNASSDLFGAGHFDLLIFSHVLEHFVEPEAVLRRALTWLQPGGRVLVALPNVRHVSVLWDLLFRDDFRYQQSGILDRTHLRFYTCSSGQRMLQECGLQLLRSEPEFGGGKSKLLNRLTLGRGSRFAAYAYNMLARRP
jgi:SAM-dependent methyltransferase